MDNLSIKEININGYNTCFVEKQDAHGYFLLVVIPPNAGKDISDFCGKLVDGHLVKEIDYCVIDGNRFIKAYY